MTMGQQLLVLPVVGLFLLWCWLWCWISDRLEDRFGWNGMVCYVGGSFVLPLLLLIVLLWNTPADPQIEREPVSVEAPP